MKKCISAEAYLDKVYGAWAGKCAGGIIGAKQENNKSVMHYTFDTVFPDSTPPNDDFDLQILYLQEVIEKRGFNFNQNDLAREFAKHNRCWANEYRVAIKNVDCGIMPPASGSFCNDFFKFSNGCPIRSELWGVISPGDPERACRFVNMDGCVDHGRESIEAERFFAVMESNAFFVSDIYKLVDEALKYVDTDGKVYRCARFVFEQYAKNNDWRDTRARLIREFGSSDASNAVVNMGIVLISLLYGKGDFNDTMLIAVNCGYDTDCTAATSGAILGIILGKKNISPEWLGKIGETFVIGTVDIVRERNTLGELSEDTLSAAYALWRDGLTDVEITDLPEGFKCGIPVYDPAVTCTVEYADTPSVSAVHKCVFTVTLCNETESSVFGKLTFDAPENIEVTLECAELRLGRGKCAAVKGVARVKAGVENLPVRNVGKINFEYGAGAMSQEIGFMGEAKYKLYGPYFDNYDTERYDHDVNGETMPKDLFSMFNGFVNIENEYAASDAPEGSDCKVFYSAEDKIPVESYVQYSGPCCVYLVRDLFSKEEQTIHMLIGHSAPHKVYVNGECVAYSHDNNVCWMPLNNAVEIKLKKGKNRLVYKLVRTNGAFEFSTILSQREFGAGVLVDLENYM